MFKDRFILLTTILSLILLQIMLWALFLNRGELPPQVPFNYLAPWGTERLASFLYLWYLPGLGGLFLMVNLIIWVYLSSRTEKLMAQFLSLSTTLVNWLLTFALLRILNLMLRWF